MYYTIAATTTMAFKPFANEASLLRRVECVIKRHDNNYFVGWTDEQLSALDDDVRPTRALDAAEASLVSKNERLLNKKLSESDEATKLCDDVRSGTFTLLTSVKTEAAKAWKSASGQYDASRATHGIGKIYN